MLFYDYIILHELMPPITLSIVFAFLFEKHPIYNKIKQNEKIKIIN